MKAEYVFGPFTLTAQWSSHEFTWSRQSLLGLQGYTTIYVQLSFGSNGIEFSSFLAPVSPKKKITEKLSVPFARHQITIL